MRRIELAVVLTAVILATGCRAIANESRSVVQAAASAIIAPFVEAQACMALTQSSYRKASAVAPRRQEPAISPLAPAKPAVIAESLPRQKFLLVKLAPAPSAKCPTTKKKLFVVTSSTVRNAFVVRTAV